MSEQVKINTKDNFHQRDEIGTFAWALVLIWGGVVFLAENLGFLSSWKFPIPGLPENYHFFSAWPIVFLGAGLIFLVSAILQIIIPGHRRHFTGHLVLAAVGFGVGLGQIFSWSLIGPFVLIALGLSFLLRGIIDR
jgi:hypothetical protein